MAEAPVRVVDGASLPGGVAREPSIDPIRSDRLTAASPFPDSCEEPASLCRSAMQFGFRAPGRAVFRRSHGLGVFDAFGARRVLRMRLGSASCTAVMQADCDATPTHERRL